MDTYLRYLVIFLMLERYMYFSERVPISVTTGVYWKPVSEAVIYESSVPLVYRSKWPAAEMAYLTRPAKSGFCDQTANDPQCVLYSWLLQADKEVGKRIKWLNESIGEEAITPSSDVKFRGTRSIKFLGNLAHWCCGVVTSRQLKPLFANQQKMSQFEQDLNLQVAEAFAEIDNVTLNMKEYSIQMEQVFAQVLDVGVNVTKTLDRFQQHMFTADLKNDHKSFSLLQISTHHVIRQLQTIQLVSRLEILSQCRERKLPNTIVSLTKLKTDLATLASAIGDDDYELVVPVEDITMYLKLDIADCIISGDDIIVHLKIPIRKQGSQWRLYELMAVPFAWGNNTCTIQHAAPFLAADGERLMTIQGSATHDCQPYENPMCYVPRYAGDAVSGSLCPRKMFLGATIQELSSLCVFSCVPGENPLVSRIDDVTYVLTHVTGEIVLACRHGRNKTITIDERKLGAVEIKVACDCQLLLNSQVLVSEAYPCHKGLSVSEVIHIVPAAWSKLKSLKLSSQHTHTASTFETMEECLDEMWPTQVPHWNLSFSERGHQPPRVLLLPAGERDWYATFLAVLHGIFMVIVSVIVVRNPHLIGLGFQGAVRADDNSSLSNNNNMYVIEFWLSVLMMLIFVLGIRMLKKAFRRWKSKVSAETVEIGARRPLEDDHLPKDLPLAEIDGKELRVTLEWWTPGPDVQVTGK